MSHVSPLSFSPFGISGLSLDSPFLFLLFFCLVLLLFLSSLVVVAVANGPFPCIFTACSERFFIKS